MTECGVQVISSITLDDRDRAFSNNSYLFDREKYQSIRQITKDMCEYYGKKIIQDKEDYMKGFPLGFEDGQYMIGLSYNTPDNTLPIFWAQGNGWVPIFERKTKKTGENKHEIDSRKYY